MHTESFQLGSNRAALRYESHVLLFMEPFVSALIDAVQPQGHESLLDVACGTGIVARTAATAVEDLRVTGADINDEMLSVARQKAPEISWVQAPADRIPLPDGAFDIVTCQQGIQFFPDPVKAAAEMRRLISPRGRVAATMWAPLDRCPYFRAQAEALDACVGESASAGLRAAVRPDGEQFLREAFGSAGFTNVEISLVESLVQLPPIDRYAREQLESTPWFAAYEQAGGPSQGAFDEHMAGSLSPYSNGDGALVPFASWLVVSRGPSH